MDPDVDPVEQFAKLPLPERVAHKNWKVREAAYRELTDKFRLAEEDGKIYSDFFSSLGKIVRDANAAAQLAGFDLLAKYADTAPPALVRRAASDIAKGIVEKGLAGRPTNKAKAIEAFLMFIGADAGDVAVESMAANGFKHRTPKVVAASVDVLTQATATYGIRAVPVKPITTKIAPLFNHSQEVVRNAAKALVIELHRWVGDAVKAVVKGAKEVTIKEIDAACTENASKPKPSPLKLTRSMEQRVRERGAGEEESDGDDGFGDGEQEEEELDLAEEINLLEKLAKAKIEIEEGVTKDWYTALDSKKWSARKAALDEAIRIVAEARLTPGNHQEVITRLRKILGKDSNVNVVASAALLIQKMAHGLRKNFSPGAAKALTVDLFGRLKEKNRIVVSAVSSALDALHSKKCIRITELLEEISAASKHKVPKARCELLEWLSRSITTGISGADLKGAPLKCFGGIFVKATDDSTPEVRDAGLGGLAALLKIVGERNVALYLEKLDKKRKEKVDTMASKLPSPKKAAASQSSAGVSTRSTAKKKKGADHSTTAKAPPKSTGRAKTPTGPKPSTKPVKLVPAESDDEGDIGNSAEDALSRAANRFEGFDLEQWSAKSFKARAAVAAVVYEGLKEKDSLLDEDVNLVLGLLSNLPGLEDSNFMALKPKLELFGLVASKCANPLPRKSLRPLLLVSVEKLGDIKCAKLANEIMLAYAEATSARYLFQILAQATLQTKNGRSATGMLKFGISMVEDFGIPAVPLKEVAKLTASSMGHATTAARNAATALACKTAVRVENGLFRKMLVDNSASEEVLEVFDSEVQKYSKDFEPATRRKRFDPPLVACGEESIPVAVNESTTETLDDTNKHSALVIEDDTAGVPEKDTKSPTLAPTVRVSLVQEFPAGSRLFLDIKNSNWKKRQEALAAVDKAIADSQDFIDPALGPDLLVALRTRLSDSNRNIAVTAYGVLGRLIRAMGAGGVIHLKATAPAVLGQGCVDIKKTVREAATKVLREWFDVFGLAPLIPYCHLPVASLNSSFRKDFLEWLLPRLQGEIGDFDSSREDLTPLVDPLLSCLRDRIAEVRHLADLCIEQVIRSLGIATLDAKLAVMTKAARNHIEPMLEKYRGGGQRGPSRTDAMPPSGTGIPTPRSSRQRPRSLALPRTPASRGVGAAAEHVGTPAGSGMRRPRPASARITPTVTPANDFGAQLEAAEAELPMFLPNNGRDARARRYAAKKRLFLEELSRTDPLGEIQPLVCEDIEDLAEEVNDCCSVAIAAKLTAPVSRFRMHTEAVEDVTRYLEKNPESLLFAADVLFRWTACRIEDSRTPATALEKMGKFICTLCEILLSSGAKIGEYEAGAVLPPVIDRCGSSREGVREAMRAALLSVGDIVDDELLLSLLTSCLRFPVSPVAHMEVSSEICRLVVKRCGLGAGMPPGVLPTLGRLAGGEDEGAGRAAAVCLERAHEFFGDDLWNLVGELSEVEATLLDERLTGAGSLRQERIQSHDTGLSAPVAIAKNDTVQHETNTAAAQVQGFPSNIRNEDFRLSVAPAPPSSVMTSISDALSTATPQKTRDIDAGRIPATPALRTQFIDGASSNADGDLLAADILSRLRSEDRDSQLSGLASIFDDLKGETLLLSCEGGAELLVQLVHCFVGTLNRLQNRSGTDDDPAVLKSFIKGIVRFAKEPDLLRRLNQSGMERLLEDALDAMVPQAVEGVDDWDQVRRGVNVVIVKMLESCDQNLLYTVTIQLLMQNIKAIHQHGMRDASSPLAKSSICLKSIAKITKRGFRNCRINALLLDIHVFLMKYPVKKDGSWLYEDQSFAMRLLKTVVNTLISEVRAEVLLHLDLVPEADGSHLVSYVKMMLAIFERMEDEGRDSSTPYDERKMEAEVSAAGCLSSIEGGANCDLAVHHLQTVVQSYPEIDLDSLLRECSEVVREKVRDGLQRVGSDPYGKGSDGGKSTGEVSFLGASGTFSVEGNKVGLDESVADASQAERRENALSTSSSAVTVPGQSLSDDGYETGYHNSAANQGAGQVYLKRLQEIQLRYGLQTGSVELAESDELKGSVEKENGSLEKQEVRQEVRGKASLLRDRMARIREQQSVPKE